MNLLKKITCCIIPLDIKKVELEIDSMIVPDIPSIELVRDMIQQEPPESSFVPDHITEYQCNIVSDDFMEYQCSIVPDPIK